MFEEAGSRENRKIKVIIGMASEIAKRLARISKPE
jgi:hypothetical protein